MTDNDSRAYVPRHARIMEEPTVPEIIKEIPVIEALQEEAAEEETPAALPEEKDDGRTAVDVKKKLLAVIFAVSMLLIMAVFLGRNGAEENGNAVESDPVISANPMDPDLRNMWLSNKGVNEDYIGQIVFDSGLIDLPFVQAKDVYRDDGTLYSFYTKEGQLVTDPTGFSGNDVYIWTNWKTGEYDYADEGGSVFMDYRNTVDDQNLIIYGHHYARDFDPSGSRQFSPLDLLLDEENYAGNRSLKLILDNQIREYTVTNVFRISILDDYQIQCVRTDMDRDLSGNGDEGFFEQFIDYMNGISLYDTGETLKPEDCILTLVTCLEHQPEYRQIIICRETGRQLFDG